MLRQVLDVARVSVRGHHILATPYRRPTMYGSLHLPETYGTDGTWNWWEVVKAGPDVESKLGLALRPGDIFRTPWRPPVDTGMDDAQGRMLMFIPCSVQVAGKQGKLVWENNVQAVYPKTWND